MASSSHPLHILVVGAGAVGCFYASKLHDVSRAVVCSLWSSCHSDLA